MMTLLRRFRRTLPWGLDAERGATAVEYGLIVALIALMVLAGVTAVGQSLAGTFGDVADGLERCAKFADKEVAEAAEDKVGGWKCHQ